MKEGLRRGLELYLASAFIYGIGLLVCFYLPFYEKIISVIAKRIILWVYISFLIISPFYYLFSTKYKTNKPWLFLHGMGRIIRQLSTRKKLHLEKEEKVAALFLLVKLFFLPLMISFFHKNLYILIRKSAKMSLYPLALATLFTLDTGIFAFGYTFEFRSLKNVVKSVEPTFFGWFVALICYPPFNGIAGNYIPWGANDYALFSNPTFTIVMQVSVVLLLIIYVWASVALGAKASNLTNRGIVAKFPYSIIRHPAYISKNLVWWLTLLPAINFKFALGMLFWTIIYFFRAMTEERHLLEDPDYQEYCKKVKYRFIPYIF